MDEDTRIALLELRASVADLRASVGEFRQHEAQTHADMLRRLDELVESVKQVHEGRRPTAILGPRRVLAPTIRPPDRTN